MSIVDIINDRKGGMLAPSEIERRNILKIQNSGKSKKEESDIEAKPM